MSEFFAAFYSMVGSLLGLFLRLEIVPTVTLGILFLSITIIRLAWGFIVHHENSVANEKNRQQAAKSWEDK